MNIYTNANEVALNACHFSSSKKQRNSSIELLRLLAQWMIVLYHLLYNYFYPLTGISMYKAVWLPLHTGVVLYILISGYYGIHPSVKGLIKLLAITVVYTIPLSLYSDIVSGDSWKKILSDCLFLSRSPFWFVRTYIFLYLLAPFINKVIDNKEGAFSLLVILSFISIYVGTIGNDPSLRSGKDIVNFVLIYIIGHELRRNKCKWEGLKFPNVLFSWLFFNLVIVSAWWSLNHYYLGDIVWRFSFPYHSPILIFNTILLFLVFCLKNFTSKAINTIATSAFAVYLIHSHPFIRYQVLVPICSTLFVNFKEPVLPWVILLLSILVMLAAITVDKALYPLWKMIESFSSIIDKKTKKLIYFSGDEKRC